MNILFIYAHLDDETILSYGTILKYKSLGYRILVAILCGNGRLNNNNDKRLNVFKNINIETILFNNNDLTLTNKIIKQNIDSIKFQPNIVITHSIHDIHFEHRLVAEEVLIKYRPITKNTVKKFLTTISPTYLWTYNQFGNFKPSVFIDISKYMKYKKEQLKQYSTELPQNINDLRSVESILNWNRQFGYNIGVDYAEAYEQLYEIQ